jgi:hypothetical protein
MLTYALPNNTAGFVKLTILGKQVGSSNTYQAEIFQGYVNQAGTLNSLGSNNLVDVRGTTTATTTWNPPQIIASGVDIIINTGANASTTINWFATVDIYLSLA